jgi:hypothetical protein
MTNGMLFIINKKKILLDSKNKIQKNISFSCYKQEQLIIIKWKFLFLATEVGIFSRPYFGVNNIEQESNSLIFF